MKVIKRTTKTTCEACFVECSNKILRFTEHGEFQISIGALNIILCREHLARLMKMSITQIAKEEKHEISIKKKKPFCSSPLA